MSFAKFSRPLIVQNTPGRLLLVFIMMKEEKGNDALECLSRTCEYCANYIIVLLHCCILIFYQLF